MIFSSNRNIENNELLYRAFHWDDWVISQDRISTALFTSSSDISVDRDGRREDREILIIFRKRRNYKNCGLLKTMAEKCRLCETEPYPNMKIFNIYHALIRGNGRKNGTTKSQGKKLLKNFELVEMARFY